MAIRGAYSHTSGSWTFSAPILWCFLNLRYKICAAEKFDLSIVSHRTQMVSLYFLIILSLLMSLVFLFICLWHSFFHTIHYITYWGNQLNLFYLINFLLLKFQLYFSCISVSSPHSSFVWYVDLLITLNSLFLLFLSSFWILFPSSFIKYPTKIFHIFWILYHSHCGPLLRYFPWGGGHIDLDLSSFLFYSIDIYAFFINWVYQLLYFSQYFQYSIDRINMHNLDFISPVMNSGFLIKPNIWILSVESTTLLDRIPMKVSF